MHYRLNSRKAFILASVLLGSGLATPALHAADTMSMPSLSGIQAAETTAKVLAVDVNKHTVDIETSGGKKGTLQLTEDARNLGQLKAGDVISLKIVRSTAINILDAGSASVGAATVQGGERALPGAMPGVNAYQETTVISKIVKIDTAKNEVTLLGPDGQNHNITVEKPELQAKLKDLKAGQLVSIVARDAVSVSTAHPE